MFVTREVRKMWRKLDWNRERNWGARVVGEESTSSENVDRAAMASSTGTAIINCRVNLGRKPEREA